MASYVIVTDSSADLSAQMAEKAGVQVLPLRFTVEGKTYYNWPDNREMELQGVLPCAAGGGGGHHRRREYLPVSGYAGAHSAVRDRRAGAVLLLRPVRYL